MAARAPAPKPEGLHDVGEDARDHRPLAALATHPPSLASNTFRRQTSKVGAGCLNWARPVLCGGRSVMSVPTAMCMLLCGHGRHLVLWPGSTLEGVEAAAEEARARLRKGESVGRRLPEYPIAWAAKPPFGLRLHPPGSGDIALNYTGEPSEVKCTFTVCALKARFSSGGRFHPDKCRWVR